MKDVERTVMVRHLHQDVTKEELKVLFSDVGPVQRAVVVCEKRSKKSKGFGFVTFVLPADAGAAVGMKNGTLVKDKKIIVELATKTPPPEVSAKKASSSVAAAAAGKQLNVKEKEPTTEIAPPATTKEEEEQQGTTTTVSQPPHPSAAEEGANVIVIFNLPKEFTDKQLRDRLMKHDERVMAIDRNDETGRVRVTYETARDATHALKEIHGRNWGGVTVVARRGSEVAAAVAGRGRGKSDSRIIVRNLGFHVEDAEFAAAFARFGTVLASNIVREHEPVAPSGGEGGASPPTKPRSRGFGFVVFVTREEAERAVKEMNGTKKLGAHNGKLPIAVDFAVSRNEYNQLKRNSSTGVDAEAEKKEEEEPTHVEAEHEEGEDVPRTAPSQDAGVAEGRTLFVTNLLFETDENSLRERFTEFGAVRGVKIVKHPDGQRSRGCAFVEFWRRNAADAVLDSTEPLMLDGRVVYAKRAVDKASAAAFTKGDAETEERRKKMHKDKRHLYLAEEGRVMSGQAPAGDMTKRESAERETKTKLKSPLFFVNPVRLSVRNLNKKPGETVDGKALKKLFLDAARAGMKKGLVRPDEGDRDLFVVGSGEGASTGGNPRVVKAIVFEERDEGGGEGRGRSTGFGFVEFTRHDHALAALREVNNSPEYAAFAVGGSAAAKLPEESRPRLIVAFAVENKAKLKIQELRRERSLKRARDVTPGGDPEKRLKRAPEEQQQAEGEAGRNKVNEDERANREKFSRRSHNDQKKPRENKKRANDDDDAAPKETSAPKKSNPSVASKKRTRASRDDDDQALDRLAHAAEDETEQTMKKKKKNKNKITGKETDELDRILLKKAASGSGRLFGGDDETKSSKKWYEVDE